MCLLCFIGIDFFLISHVAGGVVIIFLFFSICHNVNFNEKFLQTVLPLSGISLQAKLGLDESDTLRDLFSHAYECLGYTHSFLSLQVHMLCNT